jgi:hypothetical protein
MILPVGRGWQEGIPSPKISLIVASGHSPLSFVSIRWSPKHLILKTQSLRWLVTGGGVDLASSDGLKALGVDGCPIVPHKQMHGSV